MLATETRLEFSGNGHSGKAKRGKVAEHRQQGRRQPRKRALSLSRKAALAVGGVGVGLLGLSVAHCSEAVALLTGSPMALAGLMAVGIDAGMVACEFAELAGHGTEAGRRAKRWARGYILAAVVLSMVLNAYAFGLHAAEGMVWAAWLLGGIIPALVYAAGRVAGELWVSE